MTGCASGDVVLLADGTAIRIREAGPGDLDAVRHLHEGMSRDDLYLRFFGFRPRIAEEMSIRLCRESGPAHGVLGAWLGADLVGIANYEATACPGVAEIAMVVADGVQHRGVGTRLLEHLMSVARARGVRELRADTLARNSAMLRMLSAVGAPMRCTLAHGVIEVTIPLSADGSGPGGPRAPSGSSG